VCLPSQHALTFSNPSNPSSDSESPCNSKSRTSSSFPPGTLMNDLVGLYGLSRPFHRRYSNAGVPERFPIEPPAESCDRLR
jgi:hypothetical protein